MNSEKLGLSCPSTLERLRMKKLFISALSLPLYSLGGYGIFSILEDLSIISERELSEKLFISVFIAIGILVTERVVSNLRSHP
ncbi:MAG: hypothetical protein ACJA13_000683 [Paraglaciecola sp.]|jgi:hypothetical protein